LSYFGNEKNYLYIKGNLKDSSLLRQKKAREQRINYKGTSMVTDGKD